MITIFGTPRKFSGHFGLIQRNAIGSWVQLKPRPQVLLMGNEEGTAEVCAEFGVTHVPDIECNEFGTPLVSSMIARAEELARHNLMLLIATDIILLSDFMQAVQLVSEVKTRFVLVGRRWDVNLRKPCDFENPAWEHQLREYITQHGVLHSVTAGDFFLFPKGFWGNFPPFAIGRTTVDNWMYYRTLALRGALVDLSPTVTIIHQQHDYSHHPQGKDGVWTGPEAKRNLELAGGYSHVFTLKDATHILTPAGLKRVLTKEHLRRYLDTLPVLHPWLAPFWKVVRGLLRPRSTIRAILGRILTER